MQQQVITFLIGLVAFALIYHLFHVSMLKTRLDELLEKKINPNQYMRERMKDIAQRDVKTLYSFMRAHLFDLVILLAVFITLLIYRYV